jgi:uncharacterized oligopeptide transporter (OPT) family protein
MIKFFGELLTCRGRPWHHADQGHGPDDIRSAYVLYIGAGAVAAGGLISLVRALPTIWNGLKGACRAWARAPRLAASCAPTRTFRSNGC